MQTWQKNFGSDGSGHQITGIMNVSRSCNCGTLVHLQTTWHDLMRVFDRKVSAAPQLLFAKLPAEACGTTRPGRNVSCVVGSTLTWHLQHSVSAACRADVSLLKVTQNHASLLWDQYFLQLFNQHKQGNVDIFEFSQLAAAWINKNAVSRTPWMDLRKAPPAQ